jgi:excinuclease ABC subunit A
LLEVLQRLVDAGNTVVVIEHHIDVMKNADHIIDLGPMGGDRGGSIVAEGTPEQIALVEESFTGQYLLRVLPKERIEAARDAAKPIRNKKSPANGAKGAANGRVKEASSRTKSAPIVAAKNGRTKPKAAARAR